MSRARFRERTFPLLQGRGEPFKRRDGDGSAAIEYEGESVDNWSLLEDDKDAGCSFLFIRRARCKLLTYLGRYMSRRTFDQFHEWL